MNNAIPWRVPRPAGNPSHGMYLSFQDMRIQLLESSFMIAQAANH